MLRVLTLLSFVLLPAAAQAATEAVIHSFCAPLCAERGPNASLARDADGNLFGTSTFGGANNSGTVFELSPRENGKWAYHLLHSFCTQQNCVDGQGDGNPVVVDGSGNLYGTTGLGGAHLRGFVFELTKPRKGGDWTFRDLHDFCARDNCLDGDEPHGKLTYAGAAAGALYDGLSPLYGVANGGVNHHGVAYSLAPRPDGLWKYSVLHRFCGKDEAGCPKGTLPWDGPTLGSDGKLYGTTLLGGHPTIFSPNGGGVIFVLSPSGPNATWHERVLHRFCAHPTCPDGAWPTGEMAIDASGNLFGLTGVGGTGEGGGGVVFKIAADGTFSDLYNFCSVEVGGVCTDGASPVPGMGLDASGNPLGAVFIGGTHNAGRLFKIVGTQLEVVYDFCALSGCADGAGPNGGFIVDSEGRIYGSTVGGGKYENGTAFVLTP